MLVQIRGYVFQHSSSSTNKHFIFSCNMSVSSFTYSFLCQEMGILSKFHYKTNLMRENSTWHTVNVNCYFSSSFSMRFLPVSPQSQFLPSRGVFSNTASMYFCTVLLKQVLEKKNEIQNGEQKLQKLMGKQQKVWGRKSQQVAVIMC